MKINTYVEFLWNKKRQIYEEVYSEFEEYNGEAALCKGGGGGDQRTEIRYAPYIEAHHADFLNVVQSSRKAVINDSPFASYTDIEVDDAFFGAGYLISSFPSLYDMYGKFMAGLDIEVLFTQEFEDTVNPPVVSDLIAAHAAMMDDDIAINSLPRFQAGMRDINSVMSSSFVVGKAVIEDARTKALSLFGADLKYRLIPVAVDRWKTHLQWNQVVIGIYSEIMKFYFSTKTDVDEINYAMATKDKLWPFTVLDFERAALGALQGATNAKTNVAGASTTAKVLSGALSGAAMGAMIGSGIQQTPAVYAASGAMTAAPTTYAGAGSMIGAGLGIAAALTY